MGFECNLRASLGERLKEARAALGLTQKELCLRIGLPLPSLRDYELGKSIPGGEALCAYASSGIRVDWLLTGEGPIRVADLVASVPQAAPSPPPQDLNQTYLSIAIQGVLEARPELAPAQQARLAADIYLRFLSMNMAKPEAA